MEVIWPWLYGKKSVLATRQLLRYFYPTIWAQFSPRVIQRRGANAPLHPFRWRMVRSLPCGDGNYFGICLLCRDHRSQRLENVPPIYQVSQQRPLYSSSPQPPKSLATLSASAQFWILAFARNSSPTKSTTLTTASFKDCN